MLLKVNCIVLLRVNHRYSFRQLYSFKSFACLSFVGGVLFGLGGLTFIIMFRPRLLLSVYLLVTVFLILNSCCGQLDAPKVYRNVKEVGVRPGWYLFRASS